MVERLDPETALRTIVEGLGQPFYAVDRDWHLVLYNDDAARHFGRPAGEMLGRRLWDVFQADVDGDRARLLLDAMARRATVRGEAPSMVGGRWVSYSLFPLGDGLGVIFHDVTDRKRAEQRRAEAEAALRRRTAELEAVLATVPTAVMFTYDRAARDIVANRRAVELLRLPPRIAAGPAAHGHGYGWPAHEFRRDGVRLAEEALPLQRVLRGDPSVDDRLELVFADGERRMLLMRAAALRPLDDGDGAASGAVCAVADVTERHRYEEHLRLMLNELDHRVKNTLAIVQSLASLTLRTIDPGLRRDFEQRLRTLGAVHGLLTDKRWDGAQLRDVMRESLCLQGDGGAGGGPPGRLSIAGEDLRVRPKTAVALSLAVHELATNALKYGALSAVDGRVAVDWRIADGQFRLRWQESGGPPVVAPQRTGFGSRMIEQGLAAELRGAVRIDYRPEGVVCTIDAPLESVRDGRP